MKRDTLHDLQRVVDWVEGHAKREIGWVYFNGKIYRNPKKFLKAYRRLRVRRLKEKGVI